MFFVPCLATLVALSVSLRVALGKNVQIANLKVPSSYNEDKTAVVTIFSKSWTDYKQFAFGHDDLSPVSENFSDPLGGWGASIVDALDTMLIMGLESDFQEALNFSANINFTTAPTGDSISVFETTIRYVGGFMSAYELSNFKYPILVEKAKEVANTLVVGFTGSSAIPYNQINFDGTNSTPVLGQTSNIAQAGTLTLEYDRLSHYTGNQTYITLAEGAVRAMIDLPAPIPAFPPQGIDPATGLSVGDYVTWGGGSDSYLEYLIKYPRLTNTNDETFANAWATAVDSSIKTLFRTSTVGNWTYMGDFTNHTLLHVASHLECFHGGNWILGGSMLNNQTIIDFGLALADACWNTYASTMTKIGPEVFYYISSDGNFTGDVPPTAAQLAFYDIHGFYIAAADYVNRPEVLETNFYAWRATGDTKYLDRAASAVASFNQFLQVPGGFSGLNDVNNITAGRNDDQPSFWFAEVLKYLYLTFDDPNHISLNDYVFNTECHPYLAPPAKSSYGGGTQPTKPFTSHPGKRPAPSLIPALPTPLVQVLGLGAQGGN